MRILSCWLLVPLLLLATGCKESEEITEYTVSREVPEVLRDQGIPQEMLGAIIADQSALWFFKLSGEPSQVGAARVDFRNWLGTVEFKDGEPQWKLPKDWTQKPATGMRFATLSIPTNDLPLEATVTRLGFDGNWEQAVADNINRWRGQVSLAPSTEALAGAEVLKVADHPQAVFVDLLGTTKSGGGSSMGMGPMMGQGMGPMMSPGGMAPGAGGPAGAANPGQATPPAANDPAASGFAFEKPDSWRAGKGGVMRLLSFEAGEGEQAVEITVIRARGDEQANVERWFGEIRADVKPDLVQAAIGAAEEVPVGSVKGKLYRLDGDQDKATYAVIVPEADGGSLFVKMRGHGPTAKEQEAAFLSFLASLKPQQ